VTDPKRLLFVCVENSNRSQMAEAFARVYGGEFVEAFSAGSRPKEQINPRAVEFMKEVGVDLTRRQCKSLAGFLHIEFDVAVTMGCGDQCPMVHAKRRLDWDIPDPKDLPDEEFRAVRDLIEEKVNALLGELIRSGVL
jgi:arsenate reductase (thioredoxin)